MSQAGKRVATISLTLPLFVLLVQIKNLYDCNKHTGSSKSPSFGGVWGGLYTPNAFFTSFTISSFSHVNNSTCIFFSLSLPLLKILVTTFGSRPI